MLMKLLSLHSCGHDTGVSYFEDGTLKFSIETERLTRKKHDGNVELALQYFLNTQKVALQDIDFIALTTPINNELLNVTDHNKIIRDIENGKTYATSKCKIYGHEFDCLIVAHEVSHAMLACHFNHYADPSLILVNEGTGSFSRNSLYLYKDKKLNLLEYNTLPWYGSGFGWSALGYIFGFGLHPSVAGKVMALGGFGNYSNDIRELFQSIPNDVHYHNRSVQEEEVKKIYNYKGFNKEFLTISNFINTLQTLFSNSIYDYLELKMKEYGIDSVALGGGCALNLISNTEIRTRLTKNIGISPACNDAGHCLGAGIYALNFHFGLQPQPFSAYVNGIPTSNKEIHQILNKSNCRFTAYNPIEIAKELEQGKVIAFFNGTSEIGPRALGNRSIIANPCIPGMKKRVSEKIKKREWFRPLAPIMREESFKKHIKSDFASPFMLYNYDVDEKLFPEATHVDNTSRIQTVSKEQNLKIYDSLNEFESASGVSALINTSLNGKDCAIAYTVNQVFDDFLGSDIDLFVFEDFVVKNKKNT
jgi:carbamoyltransferase